MKRAGVVLMVVVVLLVVADLLLRAAAEDAAAELIDKRVALQGEADVDMGGFPFLLSVLRGNFEEITIDVASASEGRLVVEDIHLSLEDVDLEVVDVLRERGTLHARSLRGRGVISETTLNRAVDGNGPRVRIEVARGRIVVSRRGVSVPANAVVAANRLLFSAGGVIAPVEIPLPALLPDVRFSSLRVQRGRLVLGVVASQVTIDVAESRRDS